MKASSVYVSAQGDGQSREFLTDSHCSHCQSAAKSALSLCSPICCNEGSFNHRCDFALILLFTRRFA